MRKEHKRRIVITEQELLAAFAVIATVACVGGIILGLYYRDVEIVRAMTVMLIVNVTFLSTTAVFLRARKSTRSAEVAV